MRETSQTWQAKTGRALRRGTLALLVAATFGGPGLAGVAAAGERPGPEAPGGPPGPPPGRDGGRRRPPLDAVLERNAERLGLDEATRARIRAIGDAARPEGDALEAEVRAERRSMRALLEQDAPDRDAVMRQADRIGAAETALDKHRLRTMLAIRALLSPEQRRELVKIFEERKGEWRRGRGPGGPPATPPPGPDPSAAP